MKSKKIIVSVINDLVTDQRVIKVCYSLHKMGFTIFLIGRRLPKSLDIPTEWPFDVKRMNLFFNKGPLFYLEYNIRLFFVLLFAKADVLLANDLDTLAANYCASAFKKCKLVYDSHEHFTEVPELQNAPFKKLFWRWIEKSIVPELQYAYTVNESLAKIFTEKHKTLFNIIRNVPPKNTTTITASREKLELPIDKNIIILQGSGINIHRGAEELVDAMQYVNNTLLLIIGGGDVLDSLKFKVGSLKLEEKVRFISKLPYLELLQYTQSADLGISLDKDICLNYKYSLPNKFFDYIQAKIPVLTSNLIELRKIIEKYNIGMCVNNVEPKEIANAINYIFDNKQLLAQWKENCKKAADELCWENEEPKLIEIYKKVIE